MPISWPATLPAPMIAGYALHPADMTARTEMEVGPARVRRRSSARFDMVSVRWSMTDAQMAQFRAWFDAPFLCNAGASWFTVNLLLGEGGFQTVDALFSGIWQAAYVPHMRWEAQATLEVRHAPSLQWFYHQALELPSLDLDFVTGKYAYWDGQTMQEPADPFGSLITFSRASTADYVDAAGVTQTAAINQPCIDHDAATLARKGWRVRRADGARAQDRAFITGAELMRWARADQGAFAVEFVDNAGANGSAVQFPFYLCGTSANVASFYLQNTGVQTRGYFVGGGVAAADVLAGSRVVGAATKVGGAYAVNDFYSTLGGGAGASDQLGATPASLSRLDIGAHLNGGQMVTDVHIRRIRFFPWRVTNTRLRELTT